MHGFFYVDTHPAPYADSPILSEDIISWDMYLIILYVFMQPGFTDTENVKIVFIYNSSNLIMFRIKVSGIQMINSFIFNWHDELHILIEYDLSSHQNNVLWPVGKTGQCSRFVSV